MNASKALSDLYENARISLKRRDQFRGQMTYAIENGLHFDSYDELIESDAAAEVWVQIKSKIDASADHLDDEDRITDVRDLVMDRVVWISPSNSSQARNLTNAATHAAWVEALRMIQLGW